MTDAAPRRPNVLLITVDQWRGDSLSCAGHPVVRTPNLDRLAAEGVRLSRHYAQCAPCGPSRASLLTGMYQHNHRSLDNGSPLDARFTNLARELVAVGYEPTLFGYTDTTVDPRVVIDPDDPRLRSYEGVMDGFTPEVYLPEHLGAWGEWLAERGYDVGDDVPASMYRQQTDLAGAAERGPTWAPTIYAAEHSEAAFLTERLCGWIDQRTDPWFAHVTYIRPHPPYMAPAPFHDRYDPDAVVLPVRHLSPEVEGAQHPLVAALMFVGIVQAPASERDTRQLAATYHGMQTEVDAQIGRLLDHLDRRGLANDTVVIVTSDHGEQLGEHWLVQKLGFFDGSYHIPGIIRWPGTPDEARGAVVDQFTENIDLMPTILDVVGAGIPPQCDGASLRPFLEGRTPGRWRDAAHWEWDFGNPASTMVEETMGLRLDECSLSVLRDRHGKYVHFAGLPPAFYDLDVDPGELRNAADDESYRDRVLDYAQRMLSWRMASSDHTLTGFRVTAGGLVERHDPPR